MTTVVEITTSYIMVGAFDSRKRYLRRYVSTGTPFTVPTGRTILIQGSGSVARWAYGVGSYTVNDGSGLIAFSAPTVDATA